MHSWWCWRGTSHLTCRSMLTGSVTLWHSVSSIQAGFSPGHPDPYWALVNRLSVGQMIAERGSWHCAPQRWREGFWWGFTPLQPPLVPCCGWPGVFSRLIEEPVHRWLQGEALFQTREGCCEACGILSTIRCRGSGTVPNVRPIVPTVGYGAGTRAYGGNTISLREVPERAAHTP